jgi:hypothetical protein
MRVIGPDDFAVWLREAVAGEAAIYCMGVLARRPSETRMMAGVLLRLSQAFVRSSDYYRAKRDAPGSGNLFLYQRRERGVEGFVYCAKVIRRCTEAELAIAMAGTQWELKKKYRRLVRDSE